MSTIEELNKRLDRVKELMDASGMSMEELMSMGAVFIECAKCPIRSTCDSLKYLECSDVWEKYLKGDI